MIKSDTDGFESKVLRGLERTIERSPDLHLIVEYLPKYLVEGGSSIEEIQELLNKHFDYDLESRLDQYNLHCVRKT